MSAPRAKALCHFRFEGLWEARLSPPSNRKWQILLRRILALPQRKTLKTGYRDVTFNSQLRSLNTKHRASLFSRFSLLWCKPEERRLFLLRCRFAEACFGASRHRRRNKGRSPCITARGFICFCKRIVFMSSLHQTQGWSCAPIFGYILDSA